MFRVFLLAAALVAGMCSGASASTVSGTPFAVQVTVTAGCNINSGPSGMIDFGSNVSVGPAPADIASSLGVTCTNSSPYVIRFTSTNPVTGHTDRTMVNGAQSVSYQIRQGATLIGDTNATGLGATANGGLQTTAIIFHIVGWAPVSPNTYTDTVTLQVDF